MSSTDASLYRFEQRKGYAEIALEPALNDAAWGEIEQLGGKLVEELGNGRTHNVLIDLSALTYMGSSMVALIVRIWKVVKNLDGRMVIVDGHPVVLEVLQIAGLTKVWPVVDDREQALIELGVRQPAEAGRGITMTALLFSVLAVAGVAASDRIRLEMLDPRVIDGAQIGVALAGALLGTVSLVRGTPARRLLGGVALLACLGAGAVGVLKLIA